MTRPAYDVDLDAWRAKFAFHPANTPAKQLGHQLARKAVMALAELLHWLVPASDDKSTAFRLLGDVLMYVNRALAVNGGPPLVGDGGEEYLEIVLLAALRDYERTALPEDPRIAEYEREQLATPPDVREETSGPIVTPAAEPGVYAERDAEDPDTFRAEFEDGDLLAAIVGGRGYVAVGVTGTTEPPQSDLDGRYGWYVNLHSPQAVNELLSAIAAAGERSFGQR